MTSLPSPQTAARTGRNYARIARVYRLLEYAAFGHSLEAARTCFLSHLRDSKSIGVFGAGDGRCFDSLLPAVPGGRFISIDSDAVMTSLARARVARLGATERVQFHCADARSLQWPAGHFDAVVTQFFLDCFTPEDLQRVIVAIGRGLTPEGPWLFADFAIPAKPAIARWRAKLWIAVLCTFFRWQAGHALRSLPPMELLLRQNGFVCEHQRSRTGGLIRSAVYRRRP